ncbi:MAG: ATP-binding cassette domain-containing protein [Planctomycetes bacterium]|nr:ATP-binding cassette domain-containing protein [Planctomycetota bacterium]
MGAGTNLVIYNLRVFGDGRKELLCADARFEPGQLHLVIGPNGAGKTSLLRGVMGVLPTSGEINIGNTAIHTLAPHRRRDFLAYQPQALPRVEAQTVEDFVLSARGARSPWIGGLSIRDRERAMHCLTRARAGQLAQRRMATLSGGELARVALASTLALDTGWLILDEPVAACDVAAAREMYRLLSSLAHDDGLGVVVVEHDLGLARSWADTITLIALGHVAARGAPTDVFGSNAVEEAYGANLKTAELAPNSWAGVAVNQR